MKAIFRFLVSRTMLVLVMVLAVGLALWFGGPLIGIGESRPLADVSVRVLVLVLSLSFLLFWLLHWPVSVIGAVVLGLLIWYGSPLLVIGNARPFEPEWVRLLLVSLLGVGFCLYLMYRFWLALRANDDLLRKFLHPRLGKPENVAEDQIRELRDGIRQALGHLRSLRFGVTGIRRFVQGTRYLYELPWYMILGTPGAGKTTAILNSGLRFPLAEQLGAASLKGVSGTRNCEWWFTNEAVLIDTAGRYTTHETQAEVDAAEWKGFLGLLRRHRPRAPINGALLAISVDELANRSPAELMRLAATFRERLAELQRELGIRFPVYVIVTKMDLLPGFQEYFHTLNNDGRNQVWGFTLPWEEGKNTRRTATDLRQLYEGELDMLARRLKQGLNAQLHETFDPDRRRALYALPAAFGGIVDPLLHLVELVFLESRYESSRIENRIRGLYFTSAAQNNQPLLSVGNTLARRLSGAGNVMAKKDAEWNLMSSEELSEKRSYFLHDTFLRVIFPEAFLVQPNARWERRFLLGRGLGHLLVLLLAGGAAWAMQTSRDNNAALLEEIEKRQIILETNLSVLETEGREDLIPFVLQQACSLTAFEELDLASPPPAYRMGLYSLKESDAAAERLCVTLRERFLLPRLETLLVSRLRAALEAAGPADRGRGKTMPLYEMLRVYLTAHDAERFNPEVILDWLTEEIQMRPEHSFFARNEAALEFLRDALSRPGFAFSQPPREDLLTQARQRLKTESREERLYSRARAALQSRAPEAFIPERQVEEGGSLVLYRASGRSLNEGIPGLFTYEGYHQTFAPGLTAFLPTALQEDAWIMGEAGGVGQKAGTVFSRETIRKVRRLYFQEYARIWRAFIEDIHAVAGSVPESNREVLALLGSSHSPLDQLARAVVRETALSAKEKTPEDQLAEATVKKLKSQTRTGNIRFSPVDEVSLVDSQFAALRKVVTGSARPDAARDPGVADSPELAGIRALFNEYAAHMQEVSRAETAKSLPPQSDIAARLQARAAQLPPFFSTVLSDLAQRGAEQEGATRGRTLAQLVEAQVAIPCRRHLENRYPFVRDGRDANPVEINRLLGPGGVFETFFEKNLASLADTATVPWTYHEPVPGAPDLATFEQATLIRDVFFQNPDAKTCTIELELKVLEMDPRIERLELTVGDKVLRYEHGPAQALHVVWTGTANRDVVEMAVRPRHLSVAPLRESGPWALLRLLERGIREQREAGHFWLDFDLDGYKVTLEVSSPKGLPLPSELPEAPLCPQETP